MEFVARGKDCAGERGNKKQDRHLHLRASTAAERTPEQHCQDRVFGQMAKFADAELNRSERRERDLWIKPAQKRHQETRGMLSRKHIGRTEED